MAFEDRTGGKYFNILNTEKGAKFAVRSQQGVAGAIERTNKLGKQVYEIYHDSFTGKLIAIRTRDSAYGKNWEFDFQDGGQIYTLQLSYSNSYATNLLKILPNVDLTKEMKLQPSSKIVDGKTKSSLFVSQDGVTLKHAYTKDKPNGLPNMVQVMVKGNPTWDDTDRLVFLDAMVKKDILPKLPQQTAQVAAPAASDADAEFDALGSTAEASDDMEF